MIYDGKLPRKIAREVKRIALKPLEAVQEVQKNQFRFHISVTSNMFRRKIYYQIRKENPIATATDGLEQVYGFSPSPVSLNVPSASGQLKSGHFARRKKI